MRILQIGKFYPPHHGGIEVSVEQTAEALACEHDVRVIAFDLGHGGTSVRNGVEVIRCAVPFSIGSQPLSLEYAKQIHAARGWKPDVVHLHTPNPFAAFLTEVWLREVPTIVTHHTDVPRISLHAPAAMVQRKVLARAAAVVCLSEAMVRGARDLAGLAVRTEVIPHGVDSRELAETPAIREQATRLKTRYGGQRGLIAFVGRLVAYKGVDVLLRALVGLQGVRLLIVGDGPDRSALEALSARLGIAERVSFLGRVEEFQKIAALYAADVFCLPSITDAEAFGIAQVEAMMCGTPVVATRLPTGVTEVAVDGQTALCATPGDHLDLARALNRLLDDRAFARTLGEAGRAHAKARYSADEAARSWRALYRSLGAEAAGRLQKSNRNTGFTPLKSAI